MPFLTFACAFAVHFLMLPGATGDVGSDADVGNSCETYLDQHCGQFRTKNFLLCSACIPWAQGAMLHCPLPQILTYCKPVLPPSPPPKPKAGWPTFQSTASLQQSPWASYYKEVYGGLPTSFP